MTTAIEGFDRAKRFQGVLQIIRFNGRQYATALFVVTCILVLAVVFPLSYLTIIGGVFASIALFWGLASILVSYWVYDYSGIRDWNWLLRVLPEVSKEIVNIHCGFDETSKPLRRIFPESHIATYDLFDEREMTEPSIAVAREESELSGIRCDLRHLPGTDCAFNAAFLLFAAHEIRRLDSRDALFTELKRIVKPGGHVIIVEHLRDTMNFLAFGPGGFHFIPRKAGRRLETF